MFYPERRRMMNEQTQKRSRPRSPSYPGINLETAIERARIIWEKEGKHLVPIEAAFNHWGYKLKSSGGLTAIAALKKFGLIEDEGLGKNRRIKLSQLALNILWDENENSPDRIKAIKEAALNPSIHKELWDACEDKGQIPSDQTLKIDLRQKGFTESAINELIQELKDTLSYAKLDKFDNMSGQNQDNFLIQKENKMESLSGTKTREHGQHVDLSKETSEISGHFQHSKTIEIPIPLSSTEWAKIQTTYPLSEKAWEQMLNILNAYKQSLVTSENKKEEKDEGEKIRKLIFDS